MDQIKYEYTVRATNLATRDQLEEQIVKAFKKKSHQEAQHYKQNKSKTNQLRDSIVISKPISDEDLRVMKRFRSKEKVSYTDHQGNYITRSGHVIDNYAL